MNILITGSTGFIGRHLVRRLAEEKKHNIICLVRSEKKANMLKPYGVSFFCADIIDADTFNALRSLNIDVIFHCAAYVGDEEKEALFSANINGTKNICELALKLNVKKMVYLSSVAVVSGNPETPLTENLPYCASNHYGMSKIYAERIVVSYRNKGLNVAILRPPMVYGEDEPHLLGKFLFLLKHRLFPLLDEGIYKLHLVYVENLVEALIFALYDDRMLEGTFFIADEDALTIREVFTLFAKGKGAPPPWCIPAFLRNIALRTPYLGTRLKFFMKDRVYSIDRIKSLGFKVPYRAEDSLLKSARDFSK